MCGQHLLENAVPSMHLQGRGMGVQGGKTACVTDKQLSDGGCRQGCPSFWLAQLCMLVSTSWPQRRSLTSIDAMHTALFVRGQALEASTTAVHTLQA